MAHNGTSPHHAAAGRRIGAALIALACALALWPAGESRGSGIDPITVNFKTGRPTARDTLADALAAPEFDLRALRSNLESMQRTIPHLRFRVAGFTDDRECAGAACVELARRRARLVEQWYLRNGVPQQGLDPYIGPGATLYLETNDTPDGRTRNRRAETNLIVDP